MSYQSDSIQQHFANEKEQYGKYECVFGCLFDDGFRSEVNGKYYCHGHADQLIKEEFEALEKIN